MKGFLKVHSDACDARVNCPSPVESQLLGIEELGWLPIGAPERAAAKARSLHSVKEFDLLVTICDRIEAQACSRPQAVAIVDAQGALAYGQLWDRILALSDLLKQRGTSSGVVVAVGGPRCAWTAVAALAVERIGCVYLPIDQHSPTLRLQDLLQSSGASLLLFTGELESSPSVETAARAVNCPVMCVDSIDVNHPTSDIRSPLAADTPRYLLYTSGSTGKPKGAVVEHQGMMNHLWAKVNDLHLSEGDCVAQSAPLSFDVSIWQMLAAFLVGGRVAFVSDDDVSDPERLIEVVGSAGITVLEVVPTVLRFLIEEHERRGTSALESLHYLLATGEALPPSMARQWISLFPHVPLVNAYGPTECSDDVTHYTVSSLSEGDIHTPIGTPIANVDLYVLVADGTEFRSCDQGETGELFVGGTCVGRGYLADRERTRAAFFRDPFAETATGRLYRTGDLVRIGPSGALEYLGRVDRQVKVGGVRVELGEVEEILRLHVSVSAAAVIQASQQRGRGLIAFVCGDSIDVGKIKQHLVERLPRSIVPQRIIRRPLLPLTPNGKIDYRQLERSAEDATGPEASGAAVSTPIGRPISNTRVYVLDRRMHPVPIGAIGELYIGGAGVARGYLNRPELTADRFVRSPFTDGERLFKTGDLARYRHNGTIEHLGPVGSDVWIGERRVSLDEIAARLCEFEGVSGAVVVAREDDCGQKHLMAFYATRDGDEKDVSELRAHLKVVLPDYMIPKTYIFTAALPLTPRGDFDRRALLRSEGNAHRSIELVGDVERTVATIWREVLRVDDVGRNDNFFDLGGFSLLTMAVAGLLKQAGFSVSIRDLYQHQTVEALSRFLQSPRNNVSDDFIAVRTRGSELPLFLVPEWSGLDTYFTGLGACIDDEIPVYGLFCVDLGEPHPRTMEALAARLLRTMRGIQPSGPYRIAGWSWGGTLAYEIAMQLIGQDEVVEFLGLFDTEPSILNTAVRAVGRGPTANGRLLEQLLNHPQLADAQRADLLKLRDRCDNVPFAEVLRAAGRIAGSLMPTNAYDVEDMKRIFTRSAAHANAAVEYVEYPISIPIHLFVAEDQTLRADRTRPLEDALGWVDILPRRLIETHLVPGDHHSIMSEHVAALGTALSETLARLHATKHKKEDEWYAPLVTINTGSSRAPSIYCIPGAGDSASQFIALADALGSAFTVHGFQYRGLDYDWVPHSTVEAAAVTYIRAIEEPSGPLHLIGHSFGGWIAFEMASQLRAQGRSVSSLTIIDSEVPSGFSHMEREWTAADAMHEWIAVLELAVGKKCDFDQGALRALDLRASLRRVHQWLVHVGLLSPRSHPDSLRAAFRTFCSCLRTSYLPSDTISVRTHLVLLRDIRLDEATNARMHRDAIVGWRRWVPQLAEWHGPGDHMTILRSPYVGELAQWWQASVNSELDITPR